MQAQRAFETIPLDEIRHLTADAEPSEAESAGAAACEHCGHSISDHNIDNETCWFAIQTDGTVKLCDCLGYRALQS